MLFPGLAGKVKSVQLHGFSDASDAAYAATIYIRIETDANIKTSLIASKTKVAPISGETTPRLELLGAYLLARLISSTCQALQETIHIDRTFCWVDSTAALFSVKSVEREWKQFIQNRIDKVRKLVSPEAWNYCPGKLNPADIPTRGLGATDLKDNETWRYGPKFLQQTSDSWPEQPKAHTLDGDQIQDELKAEFRRNLQKVSANYTSAPETSVESVIDPCRYSDIMKLFHVTALVLRFICNLKATRIKPRIKEEAESLGLQEVAAAENLWLKEIQGLLVRSSKFDQLKVSLRLIMDESGIYRCGGRLKHAPLPYNSRCPVLLPAEHPVTQLLKFIRKISQDESIKTKSLGSIQFLYFDRLTFRIFTSIDSR